MTGRTAGQKSCGFFPHILPGTVHTDLGDVVKISLWNETVQLPKFPRLERELRTDVLIIGGGLTGLLCAWMLTRADVDCTLVEAGRICGGVSGNTTAKITTQHGLLYHKLIREFGTEKAKLYWAANHAALQRYLELSREIDCDLEKKSSYVYSTASPWKLEQELAACQTLGIPCGYVKDIPLPIKTVGGVCFPNQAQFHPLKFAAGLVGKLNIFENTPVRAFDGRHVITPRCGITASRIIVATHFPIFNKHGAYFMKMYQHRSYVTALKGAPIPDGMYVDESSAGLSFRGWGDRLLLGGGSHRTGKRGGAWRELEDFAARHYPGAQETARWAAQDCMTLDGVPYIGEYSPATPDLYVATGFNKWGMTSAMIAAESLCDMVLGRQNDYAEVFAPSRTILRPQLAANILSSCVHLLTPTVPRCPHMGCALTWNPHERSWDCPCHGSRFSKDGQLLDGPAAGDKHK